jgi:hypothetical protein
VSIITANEVTDERLIDPGPVTSFWGNKAVRNETRKSTAGLYVDMGYVYGFEQMKI